MAAKNGILLVPFLQTSIGAISDPPGLILALLLLVATALICLLVLLYVNRRMRTSVRQSEHERQSIINNAPVGIWLVGTDRRYRFVNRTFCDAVGVSEEKFLAARKLADVLPAEVAAGCEKSDNECFLQAKPHVSREILPFTDGKLHTLEITKTRLVDHAGEVTGAIGIAVDVTERLAAEGQLHQRLAHITTIARLSEAVSRAADLESIYSASMHALRETIGCDRAAILLFDSDGVIRFKAWHGVSQHYRDRFTGHSPWTPQEKHANPILVPDTEKWSDGKTLVPEFHREGIRALAFIPLEYNGNLLGKFMVYYDAVHWFSEADVQVLQSIARHVGYAIGQKRAEERLLLSNCVFTHAREGIVITDERANILEVNEVFTHITGYTRDEVLGKNPRIFQSGRQDSSFYSAMWQALLQEGHWSGEIWNRRKSGELYAEMLNIAAVRDSEGQIKNYVALFSDISILKKHQQQLEHIAHFDALTGLPNRVLLIDRLNQAMTQCERRNQSLAVIYLDLDGFKEVNDRHGHDVGDELLIALAARMRSALREGDTLARIGGDEFVAVLLDFERLQDCEPVLARLLLAAAERIEVTGIELQVSASIGVTLFPDDRVGADQLLRHADQAMYIAKQSGKNRYHMFDVEHDSEMQSHRDKLLDISRGLARGEFTLYYQPKVNMRLGEVIGAEALIRWQHPDKGILGPEEFIPVIKDHRLEIEIGEWVIESALLQIASWNELGLNIPVSVNISAQHLQQKNFAMRIAEMLTAFPEVKKGQLELEILETNALDDMQHVAELMVKCRTLGVKFALDDFGTGYSSLTYLKRLPARTLKIDQSFVIGMLENLEDFAIVEGVIGLSVAFQREIIAEGVESLAHGELLLSLGCDLAQGFGIARPMPAQLLPDWIREWRSPPSWADWKKHRPGKADVEVGIAEVHHRQWIRQLENYFSGLTDQTPPVSEHDCKLGQWLERARKTEYAQFDTFEQVVNLHDEIHAAGRHLLKQFEEGRPAEAREGIEPLEARRTLLVQQLRELARKFQQSG